jgi:DNA-3-methyladenine glycosylase
METQNIVMHRAPISFFVGDTLDMARALLGTRLVTTVQGRRTSGTIVEVEAYRGIDDAAAHSCRGRTQRNSVMFEAAGHVYVYLIYGLHHCVNIVTEEEGEGAAVLIRALEPDEGIEWMRERRGDVAWERLLQGPGNVCRGMGIDLGLSGEYLPASEKIWIETPEPSPQHEISTSTRIGITKAVDLPWRFYLPHSSAVSGPRRRG